MSMIGKLRQVSEFDLARYKKNPGEMVRALAGAQHTGDPAGFATLRETLQQSPVVQKIMELSKQQKALSREEQVEMQQEMMKLMKQAVQMQKGGLAKVSSGEAQPGGRAASEELDLHKSWHCLHFMLTGKVEGSDGTALGGSILGGEEIGGDDADTGYGPPRALTSSQVRSVAAALAEFPIDKKAQEFDSAAADQAGIYVAQHEAAELTDYFGQLRSFYEDAARKGNAVLLWIE
jgi:isopenicillin N synthase-like dioxygenase